MTEKERVEMTNEEKLIEELDNIVDEWRYGAKIISSLVVRIHELYKKYTYLKGNENLSENPYCVEDEYYKHYGYATAQQDVGERGFKSTEEWKK